MVSHPLDPTTLIPTLSESGHGVSNAPFSVSFHDRECAGNPEMLDGGQVLIWKEIPGFRENSHMGSQAQQIWM